MIQPLLHVELRERVSSLEKDVLDHRRLEAILSRSAGQKEAILDHLPDPVAYHDKAFRVIWANAAACRLTGMDRDKLTGRRCYEAWEGRSEPCTGCPMLPGRESGGGFEKMGAEGRTWRVEGVVVRDPSSRPMGMVEVRRDVTELHASRLALEKERRFTETLIHGSPAYIATVDAQGRTLMMNQAMLDALGYAADEVKGRDYLSTFVCESDRDEAISFFQNIVRQQQTVQSENRIVSRDGREWLVQWEGRPVFHEDGILDFLFVVGINVTETRALEAQFMRAQKLEAFGNLAGGIAHDFNNLLQAIRGYTDLLLLKKKEGDPDHQALREIQNAAGSASELTDRLLTFGRKVKVHARPVDINRKVRSIYGILERTIPKMIALELDLEDDLNAVSADPGQIEQLIINLSLNARDAMTDGGCIRIQTRKVWLDASFCERHMDVTPGVYVRIRVSDTGQGIAPDIMNHIFEPFFTTKESGKGTGLGLSVVYGIVKNHRGCIVPRSEPGRGTAFDVYFPALDHPAEPEAADIDTTLPGGTETILVVDDDRNIRQLAREILTKFGYRVLLAGDGEEGLRMYRNRWKEIDLIILDLIMPIMGGVKCLENIIQSGHGAKIVVASGCSSRGDEEKALRGLVRGFIQKPYHIGQMLETVRRILDESDSDSHRPA